MAKMVWKKREVAVPPGKMCVRCKKHPATGLVDGAWLCDECTAAQLEREILGV